MMKYKFAICILLSVVAIGAIARDIDEMDRDAEAYFEKKDFSKAINLWLNILDIDPDNERIQKKIEMIYDLKQKKDISIQKAKINYKLAKKTLMKIRKSEELSSKEIDESMNIIRDKSRIAIRSFITAYRIDPKDPEFIEMKEEMRRLDKEVKAEEEREKLSRELKEKNLRLRSLARKMMKEEKYETALQYWEEILSFLPNDKVAKEGQRSARLAIDNRLKFEKIKSLMASGTQLLKEKKYKKARLEFVQVMNIDPDNGDAKDFIEEIDDKIEEQRNYQAMLLQTEDFYQSGLNNLRNNEFDQAREDFENVIALIEDYKDAKRRLASIDRLRKEYEERVKAAKLQRITREFQNGLIALSEGRYKDAISAFEITLSLDSENALAKKYIARAKDAQQLIEEETVDENSPYFDIINSLIVSGKYLYEKGRYVESRNKWNQILKLFPKNKIATEYALRIDLKLNPGAYKIFADRLIREGKKFLKNRNYSAALKKFEMIKSISEEYPRIDEMIAKAKAGIREKGSVIALSARRTGPITPALRKEINRRYRLGITYFRRGGKNNIEKALAQFRWIVQRDPNHIKSIISVNKIEAQLRIGTSTVKTRRKRLTDKQIRLARKYYYRGINYYSNNDFKKAIIEWRKVLAIDPYNVKAKNNIRKVLVYIGR